MSLLIGEGVKKHTSIACNSYTEGTWLRGLWHRLSCWCHRQPELCNELVPSRITRGSFEYRDATAHSARTLEPNRWSVKWRLSRIDFSKVGRCNSGKWVLILSKNSWTKCVNRSSSGKCWDDGGSDGTDSHYKPYEQRGTQSRWRILTGCLVQNIGLRWIGRSDLVVRPPSEAFCISIAVLINMKVLEEPKKRLCQDSMVKRFRFSERPMSSPSFVEALVDTFDTGASIGALESKSTSFPFGDSLRVASSCSKRRACWASLAKDWRILGMSLGPS